jgi:hypothetical protein
VYERLAYEAAERALDKQERLFDELRSRMGVLLAVASLAASLLGRKAFAGTPQHELAVIALVAFLVVVAASVYVLVPEREKFVFAMAGAGLYQGLYDVRHDLPEVYRRLAYALDRFWEDNDVHVRKVARALRVSALALTAEIVVLMAMVSDNLF